MSGRGDARLESALLGALASGPKDVLGLLSAVRSKEPGLLARREGALHAALYREVRAGFVVMDGASPRGLALYRPASSVAAAAVPPSAPATPEAERLSSAVRDPAARRRIGADVAAHLASLDAEGRRRSFGSLKAARHLLRRVDRGRPTVCVPAAFLDYWVRLSLHEGPWIVGAVIAFLLVKHFVLEVYVIPSRSMVPTLEVGDRVLVTKILHPEVPERWQIVTYLRNGVTYVKRAVGLPGEKIALRHGDVYVDGKILVKPDDVREALRSHVKTFDLTKEPFVESGDVRRWTYSGPQLRVTVGAPDPRVPLHDVYLTLDVDRPAGSSVVLELTRQTGDSPSRPEVQGQLLVDDRGSRLMGPVVVLPNRPWAHGEAPPPGRTTLHLSFVDGILSAAVGAWSWSGPVQALPGPAGCGVDVGGSARAISLRVDRDLHYSNDGQIAVDGTNEHDVGDRSIFCLGDNTTDSKDCRFSEVGDIPLSDVIGPVLLRIWPPSRIGGVR